MDTKKTAGAQRPVQPKASAPDSEPKPAQRIIAIRPQPVAEPLKVVPPKKETGSKSEAAAKIVEPVLAGPKNTNTTQPAVPAKVTKPKAKKARPDDLTHIKGIGEVTRKRLAEAGIINYAALAASKPENIFSLLCGKQPISNEMAQAWISKAAELQKQN